MSFLIFNDVPSTSVHLKLAQLPECKIPERVYSSNEISGRNGSVIIDHNYYKNIEIQYSLVIDATRTSSTISDVISDIAAWLHPLTPSLDGYYKLIESHDPNHFRWAKLHGDVSITNASNKAGSIELTFECKPQRFLVSGLNSMGQYLINAGSQIAKPIITITGDPGVQFDIVNTSNSVAYYHRVRTSFTGTSIIDSTTEDCYTKTSSDIQNLNPNVNFWHSTDGSTWTESYDFPELYPGITRITIQGNTSEFKVIPNWWDL